MPDHLDQHIKTWEDLMDKYFTHRHDALVANPKMLRDDTRLELYSKAGGALVNGMLSFKMIKTCLFGEAGKTWWELNATGMKTMLQRQHQTNEYVTHQKFGIFIQFFSVYESLIRDLLRKCLPGRCNDGQAAFASVYTCLLTELNLMKHKPLLDFARTLRNLVHNNGVYLNDKKNNETFPFDGKNYHFEHGKVVEFAYASLFFRIYEEVLALSDDLNAHPKIMRL
jgi:hypothetical protein